MGILLFSSLGAQEKQRIVVINEGVIGLSMMEGRAINNYIMDEVSRTGAYISVSIIELNRVEYSGCLDDACLAELSQKIGVDSFLLWTLNKKGNSYKGNFTRYVIREENSYKKVKVKTESMRLKTDDVDEMFLTMRMKTWRALDMEPPMDRFAEVKKNDANYLWLYLASASLGLAIVLALSSGGGSGTEPFENPPDWPAL